jgi:hypothetical protein
MANPEQLSLLKEGVEKWNQWKAKNSRVQVDLSGADLRSASLSKVNLYGALLQGAKLSEAELGGAELRLVHLEGADLTWARLIKANLNGGDLSGADLRWADLSGAGFHRVYLVNTNLSQSDLSRADFHGADLSGADLSRAILADTTFTRTNLDETKGLESCRHLGPSSISIDTFFRSKGKIPERFLRGCGVPEYFITYGRSLLVQKPIHFYSCFISYASHDQAFADQLYADLQSKGVRCWFAPHDMRGGRKVHEQIDAAIHVYDRLLLILSEESMNSKWVNTEIANARQIEQKEQHQMLFPISLVPFEEIKEWKNFDADTGADSARAIREYFIPDFSNWRDQETYQKALELLVRDLMAEKAEAVSGDRG